MHSGKDQRKRIANQQNSVQGTSQNKVLALPKCRLVYSRVLFSGHSLNLILQQSCDVERSYLLASNSPLCWGRLDIHFNGSNNCLLVFHLRLFMDHKNQHLHLRRSCGPSNHLSQDWFTGPVVTGSRGSALLSIAVRNSCNADDTLSVFWSSSSSSCMQSHRPHQSSNAENITTLVRMEDYKSLNNKYILPAVHNYILRKKFWQIWHTMSRMKGEEM